jgi:hypothetical protein
MQPDMGNLMFSSFVPGADSLALGPGKRGLLVFGRVRDSDHWKATRNGELVDASTPTPSIAADQTWAGGTDGWLLILNRPGG